MAWPARLMPKALMLYWLTPSPSLKAWLWLWAPCSPLHALGITAAAAPTSLPSCLPLLVIIPTT
ncbi:hypothetical protein EI94DRAFT_1748316 [Lactarius quietus]|nr:hypothetical protein EI94DRAFT_1748316 [Lactarius quietus]